MLEKLVVKIESEWKWFRIALLLRVLNICVLLATISRLILCIYGINIHV